MPKTGYPISSGSSSFPPELQWCNPMSGQSHSHQKFTYRSIEPCLAQWCRNDAEMGDRLQMSTVILSFRRGSERIVWTVRRDLVSGSWAHVDGRENTQIRWRFAIKKYNTVLPFVKKLMHGQMLNCTDTSKLAKNMFKYVLIFCVQQN